MLKQKPGKCRYLIPMSSPMSKHETTLPSIPIPGTRQTTNMSFTVPDFPPRVEVLFHTDSYT